MQMDSVPFAILVIELSQASVLNNLLVLVINIWLVMEFVSILLLIVNIGTLQMESVWHVRMDLLLWMEFAVLKAKVYSMEIVFHQIPGDKLILHLNSHRYQYVKLFIQQQGIVAHAMEISESIQSALTLASDHHLHYHLFEIY